MPESNSTDPYQSRELHEVPMPTSHMTAGAVAVGLMFGGTIFLSTCLGGGFIAFNFAYDAPYRDVLLLAIWIGSPVIAILGAAWYGRRVHRKAQEEVASKTIPRRGETAP